MLLSRMSKSKILALSTALLATAASVRAVSAETNTDIHKQWLEGLSLVATGKFDKGSSLIDQVAAIDHDNKQVQQVHTWLEAFDTLQADRAELKSKEYEKYVQWVQEEVAKEKWYLAISYCARAYSNASHAEDPDAFRQEPWVQNTVAGAIKAAQQFEKDRKWYKAARRYLQLDTIFPNKLEYRKAFERCQDYILLELTYAEDSEWEEMVDGVTREMAVEAFRLIRTKYLTKLSFKESAVTALKRMLMLTEVRDLSKVFKKMGDSDEVEEFQARIQPWLTRLEDRETVSLEDMVEAFERVLQINNEIQLLPQTVLIREFVIGALKPLDRFSDMLWPSDVEEFDKHTQGKFTGVGISIRKETGEPIKVVSPLANSPAYSAGIRPGDFITHIDGKPAAPLTIRLAVKRITGPPGTTVTLTIKRPGLDEEFDVPLKRAEVTIYTIKGHSRKDTGEWDYLIDPDLKIGYVRMTNFFSETAQELANIMKTLKNQHNLRGLILDLRYNPGGLLPVAVEVTNLFLDGNKEIVSTRDQRGQQDMQMFTSEPEGAHYPDFPMIVLVNENSASASEIVTGALQAHHRALVVGERTFGKGSVQQVLDVTHGRREAFLKLTTAWYYLPNGRCLHHHDGAETWGVDPDVEIQLVPKEAIKILNMQLKKDILKGRNQEALTDEDYEKVFETQPSKNDKDDNSGDELTDPNHIADPDANEDEADEGDEDEEPLRKDPNDWPELDAQLEASLLLMRIRLESDYPWPLRLRAMADTHATATGG